MSALFPEFEEPLPDEESFNGRSLSAGELDLIAGALHLIPLSEFIDARTMALQVLDEDEIPDNCPPVRWYAAQEGLATVQGLLSFLDQHPEKLPEQRSARMEDLRNLESLLERARDRGIRFHMLVDI